DRHARGGDAEGRAATHPPGLGLAHEVGRAKILHLAAEVARQAGGVEDGHLADARAALDQRLPVRLPTEPERADHAHARHEYSTHGGANLARPVPTAQATKTDQVAGIAWLDSPTRAP